MISDTQIPYHDSRAIKNLIGFIHDWYPDEVVHIGDLMDYPQPSRWNKDTRGEFEGSIYKDSEAGKRFLGDIRSKYRGPFKVIEGNHDQRPAEYLNKYAPALSGATTFDLDELLDFDGHGIELVRGFYDFAPDWTMTHGHLGFSLSQIAGRTAQNAANKIGKSVIIGHTHRLALSSESVGYNGQVITRTGMEVGHLMDMRKASYLKHGAGNWQKGFGLVYQDGSKVTPVPVPVQKDGTFVVESDVFGRKAA
ncbi:metallophosphoesterase [Nonomuraea sp. NPDC059007]|uniref:metallophosphoesterase n=1 Tax=Nonomuraea sp. NPDC059007 TaxID=3346692 RepID=UPI0036B406DC